MTFNRRGEIGGGRYEGLTQACLNRGAMYRVTCYRQEPIEKIDSGLVQWVIFTAEVPKQFGGVGE